MSIFKEKIRITLLLNCTTIDRFANFLDESILLDIIQIATIIEKERTAARASSSFDIFWERKKKKVSAVSCNAKCKALVHQRFSSNRSCSSYSHASLVAWLCRMEKYRNHEGGVKAFFSLSRSFFLSTVRVATMVCFDMIFILSLFFLVCLFSLLTFLIIKDRTAQEAS